MSNQTLGGERIGSGKKMKVQLNGFERSTHNQSEVFRSTASMGTLIPCYKNIGLSGTTFDIDIEAKTLTLPTNAPLFGTLKQEIHFFKIPIRLYNSKLHNNALNVGRNMEQIKLPQINLKANITEGYIDKQFNQSSLMAYLGVRGLGKTAEVVDTLEQMELLGTEEKNALFVLAYYDIFKNYYANKQEELAYVISPNTLQSKYVPFTNIQVRNTETHSEVRGGPQTIIPNSLGAPYTWEIWFHGKNIGQYAEEIKQECRIRWYNPDNTDIRTAPLGAWGNADVRVFDSDEICLYLSRTGTGKNPIDGTELDRFKLFTIYSQTNADLGEIYLKPFELENIDNMRERILGANGSIPFVITEYADYPYKTLCDYTENEDENVTVQDKYQGNNYYSQNGLCLKTYDSDIFNNWLDTEWIDGDNGINAITSISTADGSFTIDTLNLANKVYNMLNRIAVSGGSYDDWLEAVYDENYTKKDESPIYVGGAACEIYFDEIVSTAEAQDSDGKFQPQGTLAGKGGNSKLRGETIRIKCDEPCLILGITSLTPRIDYSQGNEWHTSLLTMDDFHKPSLDQIGFQELITEQMAYWDYDVVNGEKKTRSAGKQPAWINYMTSFNKCYGEFANPEPEGLMVMTFNRRYERTVNKIKDLTTYIDPTKFNYAFANASLDAQNFWLQIAFDVKARRKMSAKIMPNL